MRTINQHRPRKRFGQNFLHDPKVIQRIVSAIGPHQGDNMVEIGPGLGAMTRELLPTLGRLDVVELDRDLLPKLALACDGLGELQVHNADALKFDFCALATEPASLRVVGNLPYNISTPLIFHLLDQAHCIRDMHFMLQKEVVERLAATPDSADYGRLSVMVQYHCEVDHLFNVPPGAFFPPPKVDSAIVRLRPLAEPRAPGLDPRLLGEVVAQAFSQRRKTLRNTLKKLFSSEQLEALAIDPSRRPQTLQLEEFIRLAQALTEQRRTQGAD